jgi:hypothetical protein
LIRVYCILTHSYHNTTCTYYSLQYYSQQRALQESAERLYDSFQALGPEGGFLPPSVARDVLVKTGLEKDQLRQIWNLSDIDRDGFLDHHEYVVAMFLCDAVIQKKKPIPAELPNSVVPPSKRALLNARTDVF